MVRSKMFDEDMRAVRDELGETVTVDGVAETAVVGDISTATAQELEGYIPDITVSFTFRRTDFSTLPTAQSVVVYDGVTYRVLSVVKIPQSGSVVLDCGADQA